MLEQPKPETLNVPIRWADAQPVPVPANVFNIQDTPQGEVVLTCGHASPILSGLFEERQQQAEKLSSAGFEVKTTARLVLTTKTAAQLHDLLGTHLGVAK